MTPERWQQVKAIFNSAIQYSPVERSSFLSQACSGDDILRSEVESLIASHEKSGEFIDDPAYQRATWLADEKMEAKPGQNIGSSQVPSTSGGMRSYSWRRIGDQSKSCAEDFAVDIYERR
jgi:hypothetical protein